MKKDDGYTRYTVRIPTPLYDRVKEAAGEKSVNAEIVETLTKVYPPKSIEIDTLSEFLRYLISLDDGEKKEEIENINNLMGNLKYPWTVKAWGDGTVTFSPYPTIITSPTNKD